MAKIVFRNSDFRDYRIPFYDALCKRHIVRFVFRFNDVPDKYNSISVRPGYNSFFTDIEFVKSYTKILFSDFDVYITSVPLHPISIIGMIIAKLRMKRVVIWMEGWLIPSKSGPKKFLKFYYYRWILLLADAYYATSSKSEFFLQNFLKKRRLMIFKALQASMDLIQFEPQRPAYVLPKGCVKFLYFGRIIDWKGLDLLLLAFDSVYKKYNNCCLLVVGDGNFKNYCVNLVQEKGINNVFFELPIEDDNFSLKAGLYELCDVFILPSTIINGQTEGWGLTVGEAMSMGKPVIVSDAVGCSEDLVIDGYNGYVAKHGSSIELEKAMVKIMEEKDSISVMGENSRIVFTKRISSEEMARVLSESIDAVIS